MTSTTIRATPSDRTRSRVGPRTRLLGALVAAGISLSLVVLPSDLLGPIVTDVGGLGLVGAPLAALLGFWLTPATRRASWRMAAGIGVAMGVAAAYLGVLEIALLSLVAPMVGFESSTGFSDDFTGSLFIATVGLPFGTLVLPVTVPCGLAWAFAMRSLPMRGTHEGDQATAS
jgi:hypothetical protein